MLLLKCLFSYFIFSLFMSLRASRVVVCVNISAWSAIWTTEKKNCNVCVRVMCCSSSCQYTATNLFAYSINLSYDTAAACIITILFFVDIVIIFRCADGWRWGCSCSVMHWQHLPSWWQSQWTLHIFSLFYFHLPPPLEARQLHLIASG